MQRIFIFLFLAVHAVGYTQTYYLTGRPFPLERNNAIKEVGKQWGIDVNYAGNDVVEAVGLDSLNQLIDAQFAIIQAKKGPEWLENFYKQVDRVEGIHKDIRQFVLNSQYIPRGIYPERKLIIARINKRKFSVVAVEVVSSDRVICMTELMVRWTKRKKLTVQNECSLPYEFPENGIILK